MSRRFLWTAAVALCAGLLCALAVRPAAAQTAAAPVRLAFLQGAGEDVGLQVRLASGWKFYWRTPGEGGLPAQFDWSASRNLARADVAWPAPRRIAVGSIDLYGYSDEVVLPIRVVPADPGQPVALALTLEYGVCKDICILREDRLTHAVAAHPGRDIAALAKWRARVPQPAALAGLQLVERSLAQDRLVVVLRSGTPLQRPDLFVEGVPEAWYGRPQTTLSPDGREVRFDLPATVPAGAAAAPLVLTLVDPALAAELTLQP